MEKMQTVSFLLMVAIGPCFMVHSTNALIHVVGGAFGWDAPPGPSFYEDWAAPRTFGVGDKLVFPYHPGSQDVFQVLREDFDTCSRSQVTSTNQWLLGPTIMHLTAPGDYYFYCSAGIHCEMGQKLHIVVGTSPGTDWGNCNTDARLMPMRKLLSDAEEAPDSDGGIRKLLSVSDSSPTEPQDSPESAGSLSNADSALIDAQLAPAPGSASNRKLLSDAVSWNTVVHLMPLRKLLSDEEEASSPASAPAPEYRFF